MGRERRFLSEESEQSEVSALRRRVRGGESGAKAPRTSKKANALDEGAAAASQERGGE